jgi:hypothetical protein
VSKHYNIKDFDDLIGIDPGTNTGLAFWQRRDKILADLHTLPIHRAMEMVKLISKGSAKLLVIIEDATQVRFGTDPLRAQGAGSIKRDVAIWRDYLTDLNIPLVLVRPNKRITKIPEPLFKKMSGWQGRTSSHARDAAMLVIGK